MYRNGEANNHRKDARMRGLNASFPFIARFNATETMKNWTGRIYEHGSMDGKKNRESPALNRRDDG